MGAMTTDLDDRPAVAPEPAPSRWSRVLVVVGAVLAVLLLGASAGLLIGLPSRSATPEPGAVDIGFAQDMSVHHAQAVTMAAWERDHGSDPVVRLLASDIEATQTAQIGRMHGWLELWGEPAQPGGRHMAWMTTPGHDHAGTAPAGGVTTMPGMASTEELAALRATTGPQLDVMFLQLMLRHHQGGVSMLGYGAQNASVPQVRNLASQMLSSQTSESTYLQQLLTERGGQPLPS